MTQNRLAGKTAFVTGASSGIGEAIALRLCEEGAEVVGCGRREQAELRHERFSYFSADLTLFEDAVAAVAAAGKRNGVLDIVVNSAGVTHTGSLATTDLETFNRVFKVNVDGVFNVCKAALPYLHKSRGASIINVASDLGLKSLAERIAYCPSKAALIMLTRCIALEEAPRVRANCILPGLVETPMIRQRFEQAPDSVALRNTLANMYPLKRMGTLEDMTSAVLFLASDESSFITGSSIEVCGGRLA
jgi:NAD(P)-dependent dehydrogenase (short-subunit alcohol dehydrogenase family)